MSGGKPTNETVCFTCDIVEKYIDLANQFTQDLSASLVPAMWTMFLSLAGLWIVIFGLRMMIAGNEDIIKEFGKESVFVLIAAVMLAGIGPQMINLIYLAALKMMGSAASVALMVGQQGASAAPDPGAIGGGMVALVKAAEEGVFKVFGMAREIASNTTLTNWLPLVYALVLIIPYFLVLIVFFSQVVVSIFRIIMLATLSPFMMLGFGFGWGRDMSKAGIKTLIAAFLVLFGASAALSIMLYGVTGLDVAKPNIDTGEIDVLNTTYLLAVAMGYLGTAFMTEATGIANSIAGSSLTNTATGVISAGAAGTAMGLASVANKGTFGMAGKAVGGVAGGIAEQAGVGSLNPAHIVGRRMTGAASTVADLVSKARKE